MNDMNEALKKYERYRKAREELHAGNKAALCKALKAAGITEVNIAFDGSGDSGQIESVTASRDGEHAALPEVAVTFRQLGWGDAKPVVAETTLYDAIETLCYECLEAAHEGWEINEGAFGEFRIDVAEETITLDLHARHVSSMTYCYEF